MWFKFHKWNHHKDEWVAQYLASCIEKTCVEKCDFNDFLDLAQEPIKAEAEARTLVLCGHGDPSSCVGIITSRKHPDCAVVYTARS